jgi:hypothetical protein
MQQTIFQKVKAVSNRNLDSLCSNSQSSNYVFYQEATQYWTKVIVGLPYYRKNGVIGAPAHGRYLFFNNPSLAYLACALLNSSLFYLYFITYGDCFHVNQSLVLRFPVPNTLLQDDKIEEISIQLMDDLKKNARRKTIITKGGDEITYDEFYAASSKNLLDEIDRVIALHYGFTEEELDYIINYDIKYRMGGELGVNQEHIGQEES